jgi:malonyl-CoA O-methyltransferase
MNWRVFGCDIAADMCRIAAPQQYITLRANIEQLPLKENTMDAAICAFALQWINNPNDVITALARTLKPHAPLLLYSFSEGTLHELRDATRHAGMQHIVSAFHPAKRYAEWAEAAGLQMIEFSEQTHTQYFAHVDDIFSTLKHMGATNSLSQRTKGLGSREKLKNLTSSYQQLFTTSKGIPVSWKVVSVIAKRV